jgi:hypothetical protein
MAAHFEAHRQTSAAVTALYAALDGSQKKAADALLGNPMMGMM